MSYKTTLSAALACLGLAACPAHAQGLLVFNTNILPTFSATLSGLGGATAPTVNINATDAGDGLGYFAGQFGFVNDGSVGAPYFQVLDATQPYTPGQPLVPLDNVVSPLDFLDLDLTASYADGTTQHFDLVDPSGQTTDPSGNPVGNEIILDTTDYGLNDVVSTAPISRTGLTSATLTGTFSDQGVTPSGQPIPVQVATVPEPAAPALLLAGLALAAAPLLRARRGRAQS